VGNCTNISERGAWAAVGNARRWTRAATAAALAAAIVAPPAGAASTSAGAPLFFSAPVNLTALPDATEVASAIDGIAKSLHWIYIDAGYPGTTLADTHQLAEAIALDGYNFGYTTDQMYNILTTGGPQNILLELHDYSPTAVFSYYHSYFVRWVDFIPNAHLPNPNDSVPLPDLGDEIGQSGHQMYSEAADHLGIFYPLVRDIGTFFHAMTDDPITGGVLSWGLATAWDFTMYGYYGMVGLDQEPIETQLNDDLHSLVTLQFLGDPTSFFEHTKDLIDGTMTVDGFGVWSEELIGLLISALTHAV
jgi:hypothetical protein